VQVRLRPRAAQCREAVAEAAAGVEHARGRRLHDAFEARQRVGRRGEERRIAPGTQRIRQRQRRQCRQPPAWGEPPFSQRERCGRKREAERSDEPPHAAGDEEARSRSGCRACGQRPARTGAAFAQHGREPARSPHQQRRQRPGQAQCEAMRW